MSILVQICNLIKEGILRGYGGQEAIAKDNITIGTTWTLIASSSRRSKLIIKNIHATVAIEINPNRRDIVGFPIAVGDVMLIDDFEGEMYAKCASSSSVATLVMPFIFN